MKFSRLKPGKISHKKHKISWVQNLSNLKKDKPFLPKNLFTSLNILYLWAMVLHNVRYTGTQKANLFVLYRYLLINNFNLTTPLQFHTFTSSIFTLNLNLSKASNSSCIQSVFLAVTSPLLLPQLLSLVWSIAASLVSEPSDISRRWSRCSTLSRRLLLLLPWTRGGIERAGVVVSFGWMAVLLLVALEIWSKDAVALTLALAGKSSLLATEVEMESLLTLPLMTSLDWCFWTLESVLSDLFLCT